MEEEDKEESCSFHCLETTLPHHTGQQRTTGVSKREKEAAKKLKLRRSTRKKWRNPIFKTKCYKKK